MLYKVKIYKRLYFTILPEDIQLSDCNITKIDKREI